jgi:hypothetical protein
MPFLSKEGSAAIAPRATGGYLNPGSVPTGSSVRFALLQTTPLEYHEVWLQDSEGKLNDNGKVIKKPLRFAFPPTDEDIEAELGTQWIRGLNFNGDGPAPVKFNIAVAIYNHDAQAVQIFASDKPSVNRDLDKETQLVEKEDDYDTVLSPDWILSKEGIGLSTEYSVRTAPRKKGTDKDISEAWEAAQEAGFDIERLLTNGNPFSEEKK